MTNREALAQTLLALLEREQQSILLYLLEAQPFVDARTYRLSRDLRRMAQTCGEHQRQLIEMLNTLDVTIRPQPARRELADHAYVDLHAELPVLLEERRALAAQYRQALELAAQDTRFTGPLRELAEQTQRQVTTLEQHADRLGPPPTAAMTKPLPPGGNPAQQI